MTAIALWNTLRNAGLQITADPEDTPGVVLVSGPHDKFTAELRAEARAHRFELARAVKLRDKLASSALDPKTVARLIYFELHDGTGSLLLGAELRKASGARLGGGSVARLGSRW
jgi:hypothetical protein